LLATWVVHDLNHVESSTTETSELADLGRDPGPGTEVPMAKAPFESVDEYIAGQPEGAQATLRRVRRAIRRALPGAEEAISYQIPAYKRDGGCVVYFAGWKQHYSLYPATGPLVAAFKDDLAPYEVSKGTIRFPLSRPVPVKLVERLAKFMAKEAARRVRERLAAPRKRK
jgi:uncharacterized protein YdhG (YjbR/CyaY superfamily)